MKTYSFPANESRLWNLWIGRVGLPSKSILPASFAQSADPKIGLHFPHLLVCVCACTYHMHSNYCTSCTLLPCNFTLVDFG